MDYEKFKIGKTILSELYELDATPLLPSLKEFSWEELGQKLADKLRLKRIYFEIDVPSYSNDVTFQYPHFTLAFYVGTFKEPVYILIGKEEIQNLARYMLGLTEEKEPFEEGYLEGFKDFLVGMAIHTMEKPFQQEGFGLKAADVKDPEGGPYLTFGIKAQVDDLIPLDLIAAIPKKFLEEWRVCFVEKGYRSRYAESVESAIELPLSLEVGMVGLHKKAFEGLETGDFVCLDRLMWAPGKERGRAFLTMKGHPLYLASVKAGGMKIIEQTNHYEVPMTKDDEEFMEEDEEHTISEEDEDSSMFEDEDSELEDLESEIEESEVEEPEAEAAAPPVVEKTSGQDELVEQPIEKGFSLAQSEVIIKVEIGRLKMTLEKLTALEPGNILKLNINPENGVSLVVNEKIIGRGELVMIGDLLGVRILDLGV